MDINVITTHKSIKLKNVEAWEIIDTNKSPHQYDSRLLRIFKDSHKTKLAAVFSVNNIYGLICDGVSFSID